MVCLAGPDRKVVIPGVKEGNRFEQNRQKKTKSACTDGLGCLVGRLQLLGMTCVGSIPGHFVSSLGRFMYRWE